MRTLEAKRKIVEEAMQAGVSVATVARQHGRELQPVLWLMPPAPLRSVKPGLRRGANATASEDH